MWLHHVHMDEKIEDVNQITIGLRHLPSITKLVYLPKFVFCDFEVALFKSQYIPCAYSHRHWVQFLDQDALETSDVYETTHVRTANLACIQNKELRDTLSCRLNHIPLRQTHLFEIVAKLLDASSCIALLLKLIELESVEGNAWLCEFFWHKLKLVARKNQGVSSYLSLANSVMGH